MLSADEVVCKFLLASECDSDDEATEWQQVREETKTADLTLTMQETRAPNQVDKDKENN